MSWLCTSRYDIVILQYYYLVQAFHFAMKLCCTLTFIISSASWKKLSNLQWNGTANRHMKKHPEWRHAQTITYNRTTGGFEIESWWHTTSLNGTTSRHSWSWWAWCSSQCALQLTTAVYAQMPSVKYYTKFLTSSMHGGWGWASQTPRKPG